MFPIICLSCQIEVVNAYIFRHKPGKAAICDWLAIYGELVLPHEEHTLRGYPLQIYTVQFTMQQEGIWEPIYIYKSWFGFLNVFHFAPAHNTIAIYRPMGGLPYDRDKRFVKT